jgi:hypothetical protein
MRNHGSLPVVDAAVSAAGGREVSAAVGVFPGGLLIGIRSQAGASLTFM